MRATGSKSSDVMPCPCGQCLPCRINRRRVWTHRIILESFMHTSKCFLTLTYDAEHLPAGGTLVPRDVTLFIKRLRKEVADHASLRYFLVGEYGSDSERPHYHLALFGFGCLQKLQFPEHGIRCFCAHCELVRRVWGLGNVVLDELNRTTAQYIAGYVVKKMTSFDDDRLGGRHPEFARMSNRPGIAAAAMDVVFSSLYDHGTGELFLTDGDVPGALNHAGKVFPLGRYCLNKLRGKIGLENVSKEKFASELQALYEAARHDPSSWGENPVTHFNRGKVKLLEAKHHLYSKKGKL